MFFIKELGGLEAMITNKPVMLAVMIVSVKECYQTIKHITCNHDDFEKYYLKIYGKELFCFSSHYILHNNCLKHSTKLL